MKEDKIYTVITGASKGYGRALSAEMARKGNNLILVALKAEGLDLLAEELMALGVDVKYYEADLTDQEALLQLTEWINSNFRISCLINNAGIGGTSRMLETDVRDIEKIIQLNITACTLMTHQLLPNLLRHEGQSYVLNVSSMAAYCPIPFKTVYPASKRFVHDFSRALYQELKETNVLVSVVHPGPMMTNEDVTNRIRNQGFWGNTGILSPEEAAQITVRQLYRNKGSFVLGRVNAVLWLLMIILPVRIKFYLLTRSFRKQVVKASALRMVADQQQHQFEILRASGDTRSSETSLPISRHK